MNRPRDLAHPRRGTPQALACCIPASSAGNHLIFALGRAAPTLPDPRIKFAEMRDALNLVEILASAYVLAIIGALAYASLRVFLAKPSMTQLFFNRRHHGHNRDAHPPLAHIR